MGEDVIDANETAWQDDALCTSADPEFWFPQVGQPANKIKRVFCRQCPVQVDCLTFSFTSNERFGVWGGISEFPRAMLLRRVIAGEDPRVVAEEALAC